MTSYMPRLGWEWTSPDALHKLPDTRGLPSAGQPTELSSARPGEVPVALQWEAGFFKLLELAPQLLAVFVELLQRFIAADKITVRGFSELHVLDALIRQLLIFKLKYLTGIFLSVDDVLQIGLRCL
jgi:hypothetical protein